SVMVCEESCDPEKTLVSNTWYIEWCGLHKWQLTTIFSHSNKMSWTRFYPAGRKCPTTQSWGIINEYIDTQKSVCFRSITDITVHFSAEAGITPALYRSWAIEQINYMLGDNKHDGGCYSFQIGYGDKYPLQPHHRAASCPDIPAPCDQSNLDIDAPSPQVLVGALVGGPDTGDEYVDRRTDYIHNEVATDYNSGFQGSLAGIVHLIETDNFPPTSNKCPCKS
ncbi:unnamed protein product, partial [Candidula unifasciata]